MGTKTINGLTVVTSAASSDLLALWRTVPGDTRKISKANFLEAIFSGTPRGTWINNGFTGTLPATGTIALRNVAQTFSAAQTFAALVTAELGISFGDSTLSEFVDKGPWTPGISTSSGSPDFDVTASGIYQRIGSIVFYAFRIVVDVINATGSANTRVDGLPFPVASGTPYGRGTLIGTFNVPGTPYIATLQPRPGASDMNIGFGIDDAAESTLDPTTISVADRFDGAGFYWV